MHWEQYGIFIGDTSDVRSHGTRDAHDLCGRPVSPLDGGVRQHHIAIGAGVDLHLEGMNVAAFAYVSFNPFGEGVSMKLNALMVRYIVNDVDAAVAFYSQQLGFRVTAQSGPYFAILSRENMQLVRSPPKGPGATDARRPET